MSTIRRNIRKGFTLVEILIVVVILGILAAIVIPQFTSASIDAQASSLTTQLQTIRSQLELYQIEHNGNYPAADIVATGGAEWSALTVKTNADQTTTGTPTLGPYLQRAPINPFEGTSAIGTAAASGTGWVYTAATGAITASMSTTDLAKTSLTSTDVTSYTP